MVVANVLGVILVGLIGEALGADFMLRVLIIIALSLVGLASGIWE